MISRSNRMQREQNPRWPPYNGLRSTFLPFSIGHRLSTSTTGNAGPSFRRLCVLIEPRPGSGTMRGLGHRSRDCVPPKVVKFGRAPGELTGAGLDRQASAADGADPRGGNSHDFRALDNLHCIESFTRDDDAALRFAKEEGVQSRRRRFSVRNRILARFAFSAAWARLRCGA